MSSPAAATTDDVRKYWNQHIHDLEITTHPVGSAGFFADLDQLRIHRGGAEIADVAGKWTDHGRVGLLSKQRVTAMSGPT